MKANTDIINNKTNIFSLFEIRANENNQTETKLEARPFFLADFERSFGVFNKFCSRIDGFVSHVASFRKIEVMDISPLKISIHKNIKFVHQKPK